MKIALISCTCPVCQIMYEKMKNRDEVLSTTPSGYSSTIKIRYYLRNRYL